jgi:hypothetical protein
MPPRQSVKAWIRHLRRVGSGNEAAAVEGVKEDRQPPRDDDQTQRFRSLETRVEHLEKLLEGLQDSVHRETERQGKLIAELQARVEPGTMGAALSRDARDRGLD